MKTASLMAALAAATLAAAAHAQPAKPFTLDRVQLESSARCADGANVDMLLYELYASHRPFEQTRGDARKATEGRLAPEAADKALQAIYAAKPPSAAVWSRQGFVACLAARQVPLPPDRAAYCYDRTYYLAARIAYAKAHGVTLEKYLALIDTPDVSLDTRMQLARHVRMLWNRDARDPAKNQLQDTRHFLRCASNRDAVQGRPAAGKP
jgi:hypothetical protein